MNMVIIPLENVRITINGIHDDDISFVIAGAIVTDTMRSDMAIFIGLGFVMNIVAATVLIVAIFSCFLIYKIIFFEKMFFFGRFFFVVGLFSIFLYYYSYLIVLLSLELLMLSLVCFVVFSLFSSFVFFPVLFFFLVFVCMGAFGLSLLVFLSRSCGFDYLSYGYFYGLVD